MPERCLLLLLDGLGDRAHAELGNLTPLQAARTPFFDSLAASGANGLYHAGRLGQPLPSENAHFAMFGYGPDDFPGRGALEAMGGGVDLAPGEVAVLAHFACLKDEGGKLKLVRDTPKIKRDWAEELSRNLPRDFCAGGVGVRFERIKGVFGVIVLTGDVGPGFTDTNPMVQGRFLSEVLPLDGAGADSARAAGALKAYLVEAHRTLSGLAFNAYRRSRGEPPVNGLLTQRPGVARRPRPFGERFGLKALSIASGVVYHGIGSCLGFDVCKVADGDDPGRDLAERLSMAGAALDEGYRFIHVHTKAPDQAAHSKDCRAKRDAVEALDRGAAEELGRLARDPETLVVVTADHSTPSSGGLIHSGEPVPLLFHGAGVRIDEVDRFDEVSAARGCMGMVRGTEFMDMVLNHLDLARLDGIRDTPGDVPYWPGKYIPFTLEDS